MASTSFWQRVLGEGPIVAVAIHNGHDLSPAVRSLIALSEEERLREEDPHTGRWAEVAPTRLVVGASRFELDLNRPREKAVYRVPEDAWGLKVWKADLPESVRLVALEKYDAFYAALKEVLLSLERTYGRFVLLDLHSYNHRRGGPEAAPAEPTENPQINVGTGAMKRKLWDPVVRAFMESLAGHEFPGQRLDVRENVRFRGGHLTHWVRENFPNTGCALAVEVKKFFMEEWSGEVDQPTFEAIGSALQATLAPVEEALRSVGAKARSVPPRKSHRAIRIGFVVNDVMTEEAGYTTMRLARAARQMGHEPWVMGVGDLSYDTDEKIRAWARTVPRRLYKANESFLKDLQGKNATRERITVDDLDVVLLRNDPSPDAIARPWAANAGIIFGRVAMRHGSVVLNDPNGLAKATNKMYFQMFPEEVRPRTVITRDRESLQEFAREVGTVVLKPLQGSGGQSVFLVRREDQANMNQMIESVSRDGYVIAQEYLKEAEAGDTRLFVMNGEALRYKGRYAAFRRVRKGGDLRSNLHAGGGLARASITSRELALVEIVRPKLMQDGMFLVGLDIVGDKLMEINVFSPGGLGSAQKFEGANFSEAVIKALERKAAAMSHYRRQFDNTDMAII
jgi:glutathione synthase